jgi:hypothetical protein
MRPSISSETGVFKTCKTKGAFLSLPHKESGENVLLGTYENGNNAYFKCLTESAPFSSVVNVMTLSKYHTILR